MAGLGGIGGVAVGGVARRETHRRFFNLTAVFDKSSPELARFDKACSAAGLFDKNRAFIVSIVKE